ncbi:MAG: hypothetical protein WBO17_12495 [Sphingorhabdus sp.]
MEYIVGVLLAMVAAGGATLIGFDRSRSLYPFCLILIASYYCLFAVIGGSELALWQDSFVAILFSIIAIVSFRTSLWLAVAALAAHGVLDLVHHHIISNPGVPSWWPGFCSAVDITLALYLALCTAVRGESGRSCLHVHLWSADDACSVAGCSMVRSDRY